MKAERTRARLLASSIIAGAGLAALAASPAAAQTAAPAAPAAGEVSEIVVTGTRIVSSNLTSVSPVQAVPSAEFQLQGKQNTIDVLNTLPQVIQLGSSDLSGNSNPLSTPGGVATVDLRGLGPQRTLVLVNGRRLGIGDPSTANTNPAPDINQIPAPLIDRVEVLTGGASAVYGSDAIAGVVNFIMKKNFSGLQLDAQWGTFNHTNDNGFAQGLLASRNQPIPKKTVWDGQSQDASVVFGMNSGDGRGNITAYLTYHKQDPVKYSRRDFAACQFNTTVTATSSTADCAGSSNSNIFYSADASFTGQYAVVGSDFASWNRNATTTPPALFNSNPYEYIQFGDKRYSAGFSANYDINEHFKPYGEFTYMRDESEVNVAPSALFQGDGVTANAGFLVNCDNPYLSGQQRTTIGCSSADIASGATKDLIIGRRSIESGPRVTNYTHENYRIVLGLKGDVAGPWKYDVYGQRYYTSVFQDNQGYLSKARIQQALLVRDVNGTPTCINTSGGCVPYNIFQEGGVTQAAVDYLIGGGQQKGEITQSILSGSITGDLTGYGVKSPWAMEGAGVAFGAEYRKEDFSFKPDAASLSNDLAGFGGASTAVDESLDVKEVFGELRLPLVQDRRFIDDLVFETGIRYSDYSTGAKATTYKFGGQWAPVSDFRLRASYQRAIRAPNVIELFLPESVTNTSDVSEDPCAGTAATPATASLAACQNTGVTAAQYGNGGSTNTVAQCPSGQCSVLNGGNQALRPEKANTVSLGFNVRPRFLPRFTASVDFYRIKLKDKITNIPLQVVLDKCLQTGDPTYCSLIRRAPNGILFGTSVQGAGYISGQVVNIGGADNSGIDFQAAYNVPIGRYGGINFSFTGSWLMDAKTTPLPGEHTYDCAGLYGPTCDGIFPKWRHNLRATWETPWNVQVSLAWRHLSGATLESNTDDPTLTNGLTDTVSGKVGSRNYFDLAGAWKVNKMLTLRTGITNLFDKDPPYVSTLDAGTGSPNTYPIYDTVGRRIFIAATANF